MELKQILAALNALPVDQRDGLKREALSATKKFHWTPNPGPQTEAYNSAADVTLYAGGAGSGKSQLSLGLATQEHTRSIIFRREASQTDGLIADAKLMLGDATNFNGQHLEFSWGKGKSLKLAGMKEIDDWRKHAGRERDLIVYDEAAEFLQEQVQSSFGWLRGPPGQRCRIVLASNPPRSSDGFWVMSWFSPWFDEEHPNPAQCGELRWAVMDGEKTIWVEGPDPVEIEDRTLIPHSRTFIRAMLKDNPYRDTPEYRAKLMMTPEPLRSQLLYGDFKVGQVDRAFQVIPTSWIRAAQERWKSTPPPGVPMCSMGIDVAQGGADETVMATRMDGWFAPLIAIAGEKTPLGTDIAGWIISKRQDSAKVVIDCGGGYGSVPYTTLKDNGINVVAYKGSEKSLRHTVGNVLGFTNKRSESYWSLREALDPSQPGGSVIMLPPDNRLVSDLTAPEYKTTSGKIQVTPKEELTKKLGRSTDRGDAVVMAWSEGPKAITHMNEWGSTAYGKKFIKPPRVILGHAQIKRVSGAR